MFLFINTVKFYLFFKLSVKRYWHLKNILLQWQRPKTYIKCHSLVHEIKYDSMKLTDSSSKPRQKVNIIKLKMFTIKLCGVLKYKTDWC